MKSRIITIREEDAMIVVRLLIENGFIVKVFQTDDSLVETIIEFWKDDEGWME